MGGTNVFVRRADGEELCRAIDAVRAHRRVHRRPDGRRDRRGQRRRPLRPVDRSGAGAATPAFDAWVQPDPSAWGRRPGRLRAVRDDGHGDVQPARRRPGSDHTAARRRSSTSASSDPTTPRSRPARPERSSCAAPRSCAATGTDPTSTPSAPRGGWHHTNDLGRYEADGTFTFVGPKSADVEVGAPRTSIPSKWRTA